jgi:hypothetical protein
MFFFQDRLRRGTDFEPLFPPGKSANAGAAGEIQSHQSGIIFTLAQGEAVRVKV